MSCADVKPEDRTLTGPGRKRLAGQRISSELHKAEQSRSLGSRDGICIVGRSVACAAPVPPFWGAKILEGSAINLRDVFGYINRLVLFRGQWQYRRGRRSEDEYRHFVSETVEPKFYRWCERAIERRYLKPRLIYGYFPVLFRRKQLGCAASSGTPNALQEAERFTFHVSRRASVCAFRTSIAAKRAQKDGFDVLPISLVTMGTLRHRSEADMFAKHRYDDYLHFHGLAVEATRSVAEWLPGGFGTN